uniref:Uncharacterized protein n=1 Tax=Globodera pallida TaxID=36090 RepID=A0A183BUC5_GLOPA
MVKHHQTLCFQHFCALRLLLRKSFSTVNSPIQNAKKPAALPLVTNSGHNERVKPAEFQAENGGGSSTKFGGFNLPPSAVPNLNILDKIVSKAGERMPLADRRRKFDRIVAEINKILKNAAGNFLIYKKEQQQKMEEYKKKQQQKMEEYKKEQQF